MDRRTHESPMDFEYQNGTGPMDGRSPFAQISINSNTLRNQANNEKKRSFARLDSPSKTSLPSLHAPAPSQSYLFNVPASASKPLPSVPQSFNARFATPRKLDTYDESSGGETPKSPEHREQDSDATPETMGLRGKFASLDASSRPEFTAGGRRGSQSPSKERERERERAGRRQSWWRAMGTQIADKMSPSPRATRGIGNEYSHAAERRIMKNRNKQNALALTRRISISDDSDGEDTPEKRASKSTRKVSHQKHSHQDSALQPAALPLAVEYKANPIYRFCQFLVNHPTLPHILTFYAQLLFNLFCIGCVMYIVYSFWATIRSDVDKKAAEASYELLAEMADCASRYTENRCAPDTRVPAMETICANWEKCMGQNPDNVGRARVSAHTFAEIFNGFIEPISYKAMFFTLILVFGGLGVTNFAFNIVRDKTSAHQASQQHHHYYGNGLPPPPTPQRQISGQGDGFWTPWGQQGGLEGPDGFVKAREDGAQLSPVRKLQFAQQ